MGRFHLAHVAQQQQGWCVKHIDETHPQIELYKPLIVHYLPGHYRTHSVSNRIGNICQGVNATVHRDVTHVDQERECGQQRGVDECDAKTNTAQRGDELSKSFACGDCAGAGSYDNHTQRSVEPLQVRMLRCQLNCKVHTEHVREEGWEPGDSHLPLRGVHGGLHPVGDGGLQKGKGDVAHCERPGHHGDVRVHYEFVNGGADWHVLSSPVGERLDHGEQQDTVRQANAREHDEGHFLPRELVQDAPERRRHEAPERDEGQGDAERPAPLRLLRVLVCDHRDPRRVREGRAQALQTSGHEERRVVLPNRKYAGGHEHNRKSN